MYNKPKILYLLPRKPINLKGEKMIQKLGQRFVSAGMNLEGSANQRLSRIMQNNAKVFKDTSMNERIESLIASKQQIVIPEAKAEKIVPENSIIYIA